MIARSSASPSVLARFARSFACPCGRAFARDFTWLACIRLPVRGCFGSFVHLARSHSFARAGVPLLVRSLGSLAFACPCGRAFARAGVPWLVRSLGSLAFVCRCGRAFARSFAWLACIRLPVRECPCSFVHLARLLARSREVACSVTSSMEARFLVRARARSFV